jgi:hypothetical protein
MRRLTKEEKKKLIKELRTEGWTGEMNDNSLLRLANKVLDYQFKNEN